MPTNEYGLHHGYRRIWFKSLLPLNMIQSISLKTLKNFKLKSQLPILFQGPQKGLSIQPTFRATFSHVTVPLKGVSWERCVLLRLFQGEDGLKISATPLTFGSSASGSPAALVSLEL